MKHDVERIVGKSSLALDANVGSDRFRQAEKYDRVIDHMRPDVEKNSGAGRGFFAPRVRFQVWPKAIVVGLKADDAAKCSVGNELANRLKIAVVAAILIHRQKSPRLLGKVHEIDGLSVGGGEWLIDDDVVAGGECSTGKWR